MSRFTRDELDTIDRLWRDRPADHVWTGWAAAGAAPDEVWIFRTRAHWRRFPLRKQANAYVLYDERGTRVARAATLEALLRRVEGLPGLAAVRVTTDGPGPDR